MSAGIGGANANTRKCWLDSERSRDSVAKMTGGQAEMSENLGNHCRVFNGGDDLQGATTVGTVVNVDIEYAFEQGGPADGGASRMMGCVAQITR